MNVVNISGNRVASNDKERRGTMETTILLRNISLYKNKKD